MGLLYGRAGRLTAKNGGSRPGQKVACTAGTWRAYLYSHNAHPGSVAYGQNAGLNQVSARTRTAHRGSL